MRVLYFSDNCSGHNRRFLEKLSASAHEVCFLDSSKSQLPEGWLPGGVQLWQPDHAFSASLTPNQYRAFLPEFQGCLREVRPDIVHAGPVQSSAYVAALSGFHPLLVASWGSDILSHAARDSEWRDATLVALRGADGFFCDCNAVRKAALEFVNISDSRIVQFPWGVRREVFSPVGPVPVRTKMVTAPETIPIISTRGWEPIYGITILLEAFHAAYSRDSRLRLFLLNDGSQAPYVKDFIASRKLDKVVLTPGVIAAEELPQWYRAAKGYMSCTISDGTSVSLLEAMSTGLPVVVSNLSPNREWVTEGENGWLADAGSAEEFSLKLLQLAGLNEVERVAISERNQRIVAERADWDKNFPQLLNLYEYLTDAAVPLKSKRDVG